MAALAAKPGRPAKERDWAARGGPVRDRPADRGDQGPGDRAVDRPGKSRLGLTGPLPARVPADVKELVLKTSTSRRRRVRARLGVRTLAASPTTGCTAGGPGAFGDRHAHRPGPGRQPRSTGSCPPRPAPILASPSRGGRSTARTASSPTAAPTTGPVWVAPSTFRRVLAAHGLVLPDPPIRTPSTTTPVARLVGVGTEPDLGLGRHPLHPGQEVRLRDHRHGARYWIDTLTSTEETSTQVKVIFERAIIDQGLDTLLTDDRLDLARRRPGPTDPARRVRQRTPDDLRRHPGVHGPMAIAQHQAGPTPQPTRPGSRASSGT